MNKNKTTEYAIIGGILLAVIAVFYFLFRKKKKGTDTQKHQNLPANSMIIDKDAIQPYHKMSSNDRTEYSNIYEKIIDTDSDIPNIPVQEGWNVKPLASSINAPLRLMISRNEYEHGVKVIYDPHGIMTGEATPHWQISTRILKPVNVPKDNIQQLIANIEGMMKYKSTRVQSEEPSQENTVTDDQYSTNTNQHSDDTQFGAAQPLDFDTA